MSVSAFGGKRNGEEGHGSANPKRTRDAKEYTWQEWLEAVDQRVLSSAVAEGDEEYRKKRKKNLQTYIFALFSKLFPDWDTKYPTRVVKSRSVRNETRVLLVRIAVNLVPLLGTKGEYGADLVAKASNIFLRGKEPDALEKARDFLRRVEARELLDNADPQWKAVAENAGFLRPPPPIRQVPALLPAVDEKQLWSTVNFVEGLELMRKAALGKLSSAQEASNANKLRAGINAGALLIEAGVIGPKPARESAADYAYSWIAAGTARRFRAAARGAGSMKLIEYVFEVCKQPACAKGLQPARNLVVKELKAAYEECHLNAELALARYANPAAQAAAREPEMPSERDREILDRLYEEGVNNLPSSALWDGRPTEPENRRAAERHFALLPRSAPLTSSEARGGAGRGAETPPGDAASLPAERALDDFDFDGLDFEQLGGLELPAYHLDLAPAPNKAPFEPTQPEPPEAATSLEDQGFVGKMQRLAL